MRISTAYQFDQYSSEIDGAQQTLYTDEQQVETGKAINQPSDNPVGTSAVISMTALQNAQTQYSTNLTTASNWLGQTDTALSSAANIAQSAYSLALEGGSDTATQAQRQALASQISQYQASVLNLANSKGSDGSYIFAGQKTSTQPFTVAGTTITYNGDSNPVMVEASASQTINVNTPGSPIFTNLYNDLQTLQQNLLNNNQSALSTTSVSALQSDLNSITMQRGTVGAQMDTVQSMTADYTRRNTDLSTQISNIQDVNMAQAITNYQLANSAYQAALTVTSQGFGLSLANFIK
jgi:flagellar hook-associated protein 3 FlgL